MLTAVIVCPCIKLTLINTWIHVLAKTIIPIRCIFSRNVGPKYVPIGSFESPRKCHCTCAKTEWQHFEVPWESWAVSAVSFVHSQANAVDYCIFYLIVLIKFTFCINKRCLKKKNIIALKNVCTLICLPKLSCEISFNHKLLYFKIHLCILYRSII